MDIEVCFEGRQTTFKIDEDKISDFKALKDYAAAFFSLAPEDFFFSVQNGLRNKT